MGISHTREVKNRKCHSFHKIQSLSYLLLRVRGFPGRTWNNKHFIRYGTQFIFKKDSKLREGSSFAQGAKKSMKKRERREKNQHRKFALCYFPNIIFPISPFSSFLERPTNERRGREDNRKAEFFSILETETRLWYAGHGMVFLFISDKSHFPPKTY